MIIWAAWQSNKESHHECIACLQALLVVLIWGVNFVVIRVGIETKCRRFAGRRVFAGGFPAIFSLKTQCAVALVNRVGWFNSFRAVRLVVLGDEGRGCQRVWPRWHQAQVVFHADFSVLILQQRTQITQWLGLMIAA